jgi:RNA polymerase sigma-54 factor
MKQTLQLRLSQHLTLTPQLQQSIRLLQLSTVELNQEIERILAENPAIEREDVEGGAPPAPFGGQEQRQDTPPSEAAPERPAESPASQDWEPDFTPSSRSSDDEESERPFAAPDLPTLRDYLLEQLSLTNLELRDRALIGMLIDALDDDGYLTQDMEGIAALIPEEADAGPEELAIALRHLQNFDPAGVGARTPRECLALQIRAREESANGDPEVRRLALEVVERHLELLAARDYARLKALTGADDDALRAAQKFIQSLNPRPGAAFARIEARYVVPDVIVRRVKNVWRASLNPEAMPRLRVNHLYAELGGGGRGAHSGLASKLQEARWLIKNVQQRFETILRVSQSIVDRQRQFFEHGEVAMRPLVLREIADALGLHESTISRVTTQKYMATPRGTFELKYFFGSHVSTDTGGAASSTAIRALIKQLVAAEDPKAPLADSRLSQILAQQGIVVARRTVAKYRESLQIPPVNLRKAL